MTFGLQCMCQCQCHGPRALRTECMDLFELCQQQALLWTRALATNKICMLFRFVGLLMRQVHDGLHLLDHLQQEIV